jgi:hypothetical protein
MAKMNVDFKKILLEKGERIGLGVAVGFMALLLLLGAWTGLGKESPLGKLKGGTEKLNDAVRRTTFQQGVYPPPPTVDLKSTEHLEPDTAAMKEWFAPVNLEDTRKRNPAILPLVDYRVQYLRLPIRKIDFDARSKKAQVIVSKGGTPQRPQDPFAEEIRPTRMVMIYATFDYPKELKLYEAALGGGKDTPAPQFLGYFVYRRTWLPNGKVEMHKDDAGKDVEWEVLLDKDGKSEVPTKTSFRELLAMSAEVMPEDESLKDVAAPGLVMPRPAVSGTATYPHLQGLKGIPPFKPAKAAPTTATPPADSSGMEVKTIDWENLAEEDRKKLSGEAVNIFDPFNPFKGAEPKTPAKLAGNKMCLLRFIDIDVTPGRSYDYVIVVRCANPNYGKEDEVTAEIMARSPELLSPYNTIPAVEIPYDIEAYAADEMAMDKLYTKDSAMVGADVGSTVVGGRPEKVAVQVHRWVDYVQNQPLTTLFGVGEWLIAERLLVRRGEFIGQMIPVDVPRWDEAARKYELARRRDQGAKRTSKTPIHLLVDFTVTTEKGMPPAMLVDFTGGRQPALTLGKKTMPPDVSASDLLILAPDGKLLVRNSMFDTDPNFQWGKTRLERYEAWRARIAGLKPAKGEKKDGIGFDK